MRTHLVIAAAIASILGWTAASRADSGLDSLKSGNPGIKSVSALAFGPEGILFVGDTQGAAIFALDTQDRPESRQNAQIKFEGIDAKVAAVLGTTPKELTITDLAVNPLSGNAYLGLSRGRGNDAMPAIVRIDPEGSIEELPMKDVKFAKAMINDAATGQRQRQEAITDIGYYDGRVFMAGLSNEEFSSRFRAVPFPFSAEAKSTSVEIFHGAHGRFETNSPVRTFTTFEIKGEPCLLGAYTCTPLVKFPIAELKPGAHVKGTTLAELGNRNKPLDMIAYSKDGKEYLLLANNSRGVMKVKTDGIADAEGIEKPVRGEPGTAGLPYETVTSLRGVEQLEKLDDAHALILVNEDGAYRLQTIGLP